MRVGFIAAVALAVTTVGTVADERARRHQTSVESGVSIDKGITEYVAAIELDKNSNVIKEIELPPVRRSPLKADFIPLSQAYETASAHHFDVEKTSAELLYDQVTESIAYRLRQTIAYQPPTGTDRVIEIDAHSGRILRTRESRWIE